MSRTFTDLTVWQTAMDLALEVYRRTSSFPKPETYGLTAQMRRAAVSIPSNIAEGRGRSSRKELIQFLHHARGSLLELETQIMIAERLGYFEELQNADLRGMTGAVGRLLNGLINSLKETAKETT